MAVPTISPSALAARMRAGGIVELIDVRTPVEFRECHAVGARLEPLDRLDPVAVMAKREGVANEPLYVICRSGSRAAQACEKFVAAGHTNVVCVEGGTLAWEQAGCEVVRGRKAISLERQVRIVAGSLVVLGAVLAVTIHPWFVGLSAFIGAGLVFSGVTDKCPMAMTIARMPWNQVASTPTACATK